MEKKTKRVMVITLIAMVMLFGGISYAYFTANISGSESSSTIVTTGGTLTISYREGNENISIGNVYPRPAAWLTKTFTLTGTNTTALNMNYRVGINVVSNGFSAGDLTYSLTNNNPSSGTPISNISNEAINTASGIQYIGYGQFVKGSNVEHTYTLQIYFIDTGENQNNSQGKSFSGKIVIEEAGTGDLPSAVAYKYYGWLPSKNGTKLSDTFDEADPNSYGVVLKTSGDTALYSGINQSVTTVEACGKIGTGYVCVNKDTTDLADQCNAVGGTLSSSTSRSTCSDSGVSCDVYSNNGNCHGADYTYCNVASIGNAHCYIEAVID